MQLQTNIKSVADLKGKLKNKKVLIRLDLNVPIAENKVKNDFRIKKQLPTLKFLQSEKAKVVAISHISSIDEKEGASLKPVYEYLKNILSNLYFTNYKNIGGDTVKEANTLNDGDILLLDNLRFNPGEKENSDEFSKTLSLLGDIYVNEAFSSSHRSHASIVGVTKYIPSYAGMLFKSEINNLSKAFSPEHPFYLILGGAKFSTKLPLVEKFLDISDNIFICGALANDFYLAKGLNIGKSLVDSNINISHLLDNKKIILPTDVVVQTNTGKKIKDVVDVSNDEIIFDAGPRSVDNILNKISDAKLILWNGPLGNYEYGFSAGTEALAKGISKIKAFSIIGGGDTIASIEEYNLEDKFGFISTAGGAMLEFLANGTLPGIEALKNNDI